MEMLLMDITTQPDGLQSWLQLATSTGFVGLAWYLIVIALPRMQDRFDAHSDKQFQRFEEQMELQRRHSEEVVKGIVERYERQLDRIVGSIKPLQH
jgi:hypothetical protein